MISKTVNSVILAIIFMPLLSLLISGIDASFVKENSIGFFHIFTSGTLFNSIQLAFLVSMFSTLIGLFAAGLYYHIEKQNMRHLFFLMICFLFAIAPMIYTALLSEITLFYSLSALVKSVIVLSLWLLPLASGILILMMRNIDQTSLELLKFSPLSKFMIFKEIIIKQCYFALFGTFTLIFIMVFIQEGVPSFFGYRTYAEEFLSRIILMEKLESTLIYSWPFIIFALASSAILYLLLKKSSWSLFQDHITPLNKLNFINSRRFAYFGVFLFITIVLFVIFQLLYKVNFSLVTTLFSDNSSILFNSFFLSLFAALIATLLSAYLVNYFKSRHSSSTIILLIAFLSFYWFLPSSLIGLTLLKISQLYYVDSEIYEYALLLYGYILNVLPIGLVMMLIFSQHSYSSHLFKILKISKLRLFFTIYLPMLWKKWMMVMGILFFLVLNEITTTVLLVPPGFETIIVKIFNLMHYGDFETVAFLSLLQIALILVALSLFTLTRAVYDKT